MSFVYPRTITVTRPASNAGVGAIGYGGANPATETDVVSDVPANIQAIGNLGLPAAKVPGDSQRASQWNVFIPLNAVANGIIRGRDIVTDDLGIRYQVSSPYWNSLGYRLEVEQLEL